MVSIYEVDKLYVLGVSDNEYGLFVEKDGGIVEINHAFDVPSVRLSLIITKDGQLSFVRAKNNSGNLETIILKDFNYARMEFEELERVEKKKYVLHLRVGGKDVLIPTDGIEFLNELSVKGESQEREKLKVYETPEEFHNYFISEIVEGYRIAIASALKDEGLKEKLLEVKTEEVFEFIRNNYDAIKKAVDKSILDLPSEPPKVAIFDPQAGSGKALLSAFEKYKVDGVLTGFEIRNIENNDPRYAVATGINSNTILQASSVILGIDFRNGEVSGRGDELVESIVPSGERTSFKRGLLSGLYFLNPPYTATGLTAALTSRYLKGGYTERSLNLNDRQGSLYDLKTTNGLLMWLISSRIKDTLVTKAKGQVLNTAPVSELYKGIAGDMVFFVDAGGMPINPDMRLREIVANYLISNKHAIKDITTLAKYAKPFMNVVKERYDKFINVAPEQLFSKLTLLNKAVINEEVFPDLLSVERKFINFDEVYINAELQKVYKEHYSGIYKFFEEVCRHKGKEVPKLEEGVHYIPTDFDRLGVMKYKYLPFVLELDQEEVKTALKYVLEDLPDSEEKAAVMELIEKGKKLKVMIKRSSEVDTRYGIELGYVSKLTISSEVGETLAVIDGDISKFYDKLLELTGIEKYNIKRIEEHPKYWEFIKELLERFAEYTENVFDEEEKKRVLEIYTKKYEEIKKAHPDWKSSDIRRKAITETAKIIYNERLENNRLIHQEMFNYDLEGEVYKVLNEIVKNKNISKTDSDKIKSVVKNLLAEFDKSPPKFMAKLDEYKEKLVQELMDKEIGAKDAEDIANVVIDEISNAGEIHKSSANYVRGLVASLVYGKRIKSLLKKGEVKQALEDFRWLHVKELRLQPHQFDLPLGMLAVSKLTGANKAVFGWEMRTGKTLANAFYLFMNSLLDRKPSVFAVRSVNMFDIIRQVIEFLPYTQKELAIIGSANFDVAKENFMTVGDDIYPNVFSEPSLFKRKGDAINELIRDGMAQIEEITESLTEEDVARIKALAKNKPYGVLFNLKNVKEKNIAGVVEYLLRIDKELNQDQKAWVRFVESVSKYETKDINKLFWIMSKETHLRRFNIEEVEEERKVWGEKLTVSREKYDIRLVANVKDVGATVLSLEDLLEGHEDLRNLLSKYAVVSLPTDLAVTTEIMHIGSIDEIEYALVKVEDLGENTKKYKTLGEFLTEVSLWIFRAKDINLELPFGLPLILGKDIIVLPDGMADVVKTRITFDKASKTFKVQCIYPENKYKKNIKGTSSNQSSVVYSKRNVDMLSTISVDEADQSTNPDSLTNSVIRYMYKRNVKVALSTGTLSSGNVSTMLEFLNLNADKDYVEKLTAMAQIYYDRYMLKDDKIGHLYSILVELLKKTQNPDIFYKAVSYLKESVSWFTDYVEGMLGDAGLISSFERYINTIKYKGELESDQGARKGKSGITLDKLINELYEIPYGLSVEALISKVVELANQHGFAKVGIGTANLSFPKLFDDSGVISIMSAEDLLKVERKMVMSENELETVRVIEHYNEKKDFVINRDKNYLRGIIVNDTMQGARLSNFVEGSANIETTFKFSDLRDNVNWAEVDRRKAIIDVVVEISKAFSKVLEKEDKYRSFVVSSAKTTNDKLADIVKLVLVYDLEELAKLVKNEEKLNFALKFLDALKDAHMDAWKTTKGETKFSVSIDFDGRRISVDLPDNNLTRLAFKNWDIVKEVLKDPVKYVALASLVDIKMPVDPKIFEDENTYYRMQYTFGYSEDDQLINFYENAGLFEEVQRLLNEGKDTAILASRTDAVNLMIAEVLNELMKREDISKRVKVFVRVTDRKIKEFVKRLNRDYLKKFNISVEVFNKQPKLDAYLKAHRRTKGKEQLVLVAPAESLARGVDLSMMDALVLPNSVANAREFAQLLARLFSPVKSEEINGKKVAQAEVVMYGRSYQVIKLRNGDKKAIPTWDNIVMHRTHGKAEFNAAVMSNKLAVLAEKKGVRLLKDKKELEYNYAMAM